MTIDSREVLSRPASEPDATVAYGGLPDQVAEVRFPVGDGRPKAAVVFLHGGFWRHAYDRIHTRPLSVGLAHAGYLVVTPEYRRTGAAGGGWPGTFADVAAAVAAVPALLANLGVPVDVPIVVAGHSAGGQLALWVVSAEAGRAHPALAAVPIAGVVALAPVADLRAAHELDLDQGAVAALLGGGPDEYPDRYAAVDPMTATAFSAPLVLVHGGLDGQVPAAFSRRFAAAAEATGAQVRLVELGDSDHFHLIDPLSTIWPTLLSVVAELV